MDNIRRSLSTFFSWLEEEDYIIKSPMKRECVVYGKGDKERKAYFDAKTKIHLMNYIESRTDNNSALFVSLNNPHNNRASSENTRA